MAALHPQQYYHVQGLVDQLGHEAEPVMGPYNDLHDHILAGGALSTHIKTLMALGIAIAQGNEAGVALHVHDALKAGASRQEIVETIQVALLMGGEPALLCGSVALDAVNRF